MSTKKTPIRATVAPTASDNPFADYPFDETDTTTVAPTTEIPATVAPATETPTASDDPFADYPFDDPDDSDNPDDVSEVNAFAKHLPDLRNGIFTHNIYIPCGYHGYKACLVERQEYDHISGFVQMVTNPDGYQKEACPVYFPDTQNTIKINVIPVDEGDTVIFAYSNDEDSASVAVYTITDVYADVIFLDRTDKPVFTYALECAMKKACLQNRPFYRLKED